MANSLDMDLKNKVVVIKASVLEPEWAEKDRRFYVTGGFGSLKKTIGAALFGIWFVDGKKADVERIDGYDVERLADDQTPPDHDLIPAQRRPPTKRSSKRGRRR